MDRKRYSLRQGACGGNVCGQRAVDAADHRAQLLSTDQ